MKEWEKDKERADRFFPEITAILKENAKHIVNIAVAPPQKDTMQATDYIIKVESGDVACRLRWWSKYTINKEWTIRSKRDTGAETELSKLKKGWARWYLYGWIIEGKISSWMLIDLNQVRDTKINSKGMLDFEWPTKPNRDKYGNLDGTHFIIIPNSILKKYNCIISYSNIEPLLKQDKQNVIMRENMSKLKVSKQLLFDFLGIL